MLVKCIFLFVCLLQVASYNSEVEPEVLEGEESSIKWTDVSAEPPFIVGESVSEIKLV